MIELTPAQERLVEKIRSFTTIHGMPPTILELAALLNIKGSSVHEQIQRLKSKGVLLHEQGKARSIRLANIQQEEDEKESSCRVYLLHAATQGAEVELPLFSSMVPAGFPSPADDYIENQLDLNRHLIEHPAATFFVRVEGSSMVGAGIHPGNILVVDRSLEPKSDDIVVAVIHSELTVKRLLRDKEGKLFFMPANPDFKAIEITEEMGVTIWGVVTSAVQEFRKR
jgi:DNA polymerase V